MRALLGDSQVAPISMHRGRPSHLTWQNVPRAPAWWTRSPGRAPTWRWTHYLPAQVPAMCWAWRKRARTTMSCGTQRCFASSSPQSFSRGDICQSASINRRKRELSPRQSSRRSLPTMECVVKRECRNRQVIQFSQSYHRRQLSQENHAQSALHSIAVGRSFGM
ncbi:MAG: hypothetical protein RL254_2157 [Planctomycetota bacterium]